MAVWPTPWMCCNRRYKTRTSTTAPCLNCARRWSRRLSRTPRTASCKCSIWQMPWQSTLRPPLLKKSTTGSRHYRHSALSCGQNDCASRCRRHLPRPRQRNRHRRHQPAACGNWPSSIARCGRPLIRRKCRRYNAWLAHASSTLNNWPSCPRHWPAWTLRSSTMHNATSSR
ncbi:hypothetical protein D3C76_1314800 [compost metagenome]